MTLSLYDFVQRELESIDKQALKKWGQNFLIDEEVVDSIISKVIDSDYSHLVEIGPGVGSLTHRLKYLDPGLELIEIDPKFYEYWNGKVKNIYNKDALKINWKELIQENWGLVSNLPYQISSRIMIDMSLLETKPRFMCLMFQKEVAEKLNSLSYVQDESFNPSKENLSEVGPITYLVQTVWEISKVCDVPPSCFNPRPKVNSKVVYFKRKESYGLAPTELESFFKFMKVGFSKRRKKWFKNLTARYSKEILTEVFEQCNFDQNLRAEQVSRLGHLDFFIRASKLKSPPSKGTTKVGG